MLFEIAKPVALLLCLLSLYAVFHAAFLAPASGVYDRLMDSLFWLTVATSISVGSGLLFQESERELHAVHLRLNATLPMQIFYWTTTVYVVLFLVSWYLETYVVYYRDTRWY